MTAWTQLGITCCASQADIVADLLDEADALSVTIEGMGEQVLFQLKPEETPLWQTTNITALFSQQTDVKKILARIERELKVSKLNYQVGLLEDQDWVHLTQKNFPPKCFAEKLWILPSWCDTSNYQAPFVRLDPGLAFGTGTHPTTSLCLEWLAHHPPKNKVVIDYGCGSGILSLAALALGAKEVHAIDHDAQALQATHNNAKLNELANKKLFISQSIDQPNLNSPIVIANILSHPLMELAPTIAAITASNALLVLSGILISEIETVVDVYRQYGFKKTTTNTHDEWACIILKKDPSCT